MPQDSASVAPVEAVQAGPAEAPSLIPTEDFAGRSAYRDFKMAPDGSQLAILRDVDGELEILLIDAETRKPISRIIIGKDRVVRRMQWAGNSKLLFSISTPSGGKFGELFRISRILVIDLASGAKFLLKADRTVFDADDLVHVEPDGSYALVSVQKNWRSYPAIYRYDLVPDHEPEEILKPKTGVWSWHADDSGTIRLGMGWHNRRLRVYYRPDGDGDFELIGKLKPGDEDSRFWSVVRIINGSDRGYVLEEGENGRVGARLFDYSTGEIVDTFYENPDWDVERMWLGENGEPIAAFYTDDRDRAVWFNPEYEERYTQLKEALGQEDVLVLTSSREDERMLIWAGNEADPGALYIFTPDKMTLDFLANYRPDLDFSLLVKPKPFRYTARDGLEISAYLTLPRGREAKGLPLVILPHGGPFGIRDKLQYNDEVQLLANRGYAVIQPNFRGSGGYGDAFYEAGNGAIGRAMQDDLDDAMDWAVAEGIADPQRVCVVGGSYGGYAALWAALRNPERYRCAASWAGVTDWDTMLKYDRKFLDRKDARAQRQQIEGDEDFELDTVSPLERAATLNRPVLLGHGTKDGIVPFSQYEAFEKEARKAPVPPQLLVIEGEGHSFSSPENEKTWYDALEAFLLKHNPPDPSS